MLVFSSHICVEKISSAYEEKSYWPWPHVDLDGEEEEETVVEVDCERTNWVKCASKKIHTSEKKTRMMCSKVLDGERNRKTESTERKR